MNRVIIIPGFVNIYRYFFFISGFLKPFTENRRVVKFSLFALEVLRPLSAYNAGLNEWMNVYLYTAHITRQFTIIFEWDRTSACKDASGCHYQFIFDLTHQPNPCMKCTMKLQIDRHTGNYIPYSFRQVCGFFNVPYWLWNTEDAGDGAYGL